MGAKVSEYDALDALPPMMRAAQLAAFLGVEVQQLADWRRQGVGPPYRKLVDRRNGAVRYMRDDIRLWLASSKRGGAEVAS